MKQEMDRVKNDIETMQNAIGFSPAAPRDWAPWMKRDKWLFLWFCLPGAMLIASALIQAGHSGKYFGATPVQWMLLSTVAIFYGLFFVCIRKTMANDGRPPGLIREYRRYWGLDAQGKWSGLVFCLGCVLYVFWAWHFQLNPKAFISGFFVLTGLVYLACAILLRLWQLMGVAVPLLGYGLFAILFSSSRIDQGIPLGITLVAVSLCSYIAWIWQIRKIERQNESH